MLGIIFIIRNQPIFIIGVLIIIVVILSLFSYFEINRFWFGYILILTLLRGVLVIFSYVVRLIPNEKFEFLRLVFLVLGFIYLFIEDYLIFIKVDNSFICLLLWEGMLLGYMVYLVIFLLRVIIITIFVRYPQFGALRLLLCAWIKG